MLVFLMEINTLGILYAFKVMFKSLNSTLYYKEFNELASAAA